MFKEIEVENLPNHIAIILDGNRRWARNKGLPIRKGHEEGAEALEKIVKYANKIGLKHLTVFAFSTENWNRTQEEVGDLMWIFNFFVNKFLKKTDAENVKIKVFGDMSKLPKNLQDSLNKSIERTETNTGMNFNVCLNYGGRTEIVRAIKHISENVQKGILKIEDITEETVSNNLYSEGQPDPDLVIRTSGELRTSNFLPWQICYSEFISLKKHWPDFTEQDLLDSIDEYNKRNRRFGGN